MVKLPPAPPTTSAYSGSWQIKPIIGASRATQRPTILKRTDGPALMYPGRTHTIVGPHSSGKTWISYVAAAQVIDDGGHVIWIDFEDNESTAMERLTALGLTEKAVESAFSYIHPEGGLTEDDRHYLEQVCIDKKPSLIVVDCANEFIYSQGDDPTSSSSEGVTTFHRIMAHLAKSSGRTDDSGGAAVIAIDHVTKNAVNRGPYAIGSERKISGITGAAFVVKVTQPFGFGMTGAVTLELIKDRAGQISGLQNEHRVVAKLVLASDAGSGKMTASLLAPAAGDGAAINELMQKASDVLAAAPSGLNKGDLVKQMGVKSEEATPAIKALEALGHIRISSVGPSKIHALISPYVPQSDPENQ